MATATKPKFEVECYTPNGREIRRNNATGKFEVQPHNDNYWVECDTLEEAFRAFHPDWLGATNGYSRQIDLDTASEVARKIG